MAKTKKLKEKNYITLSAVLRAKEARLLSRERLERMAGESYAEACRSASDAGYPDLAEADVEGINAALEEHLSREREEVAELAPEETLLRLTGLQYDCHNAKALVKAEGDAARTEAVFSRAGCYSLDQLLEAYSAEEEESAGLPAPFAAAIREARKALARTGNPQLSDFILDRAYFAQLLAEAEASGRPVLRKYVRDRIDKVNLRSLLRTMSMGKRGDLLDRSLIPGGSVPLDQIADPELPREEVERLYASTIFEKAAGEKGMTAFEKAADNAELAAVGSVSLMAFGPEVVLEYLTALENEIVSLRILLTGKRMGIGAETLRERLRDSYV